MIQALIVEDEKMAQAQLQRLLSAGFPDIEVAATTTSVRSTVEYLASHPPINLIFMDVELADGECFEIFRQVPVEAQVIMTTAYDSYAVKAFEAGSIDYLLKPIDAQALARAVGRCRERLSVSPSVKADVEKLLAMLGAPPQRYKERFVVYVGEQIIPLETMEIACFFAEEKSNYILTVSGERYLLDSSLDALEGELDPERFFRISRGAIVARSAVQRVIRHFSGRLRLEMRPVPPFEPMVSRARVDDFLRWLQ